MALTKSQTAKNRRNALIENAEDLVQNARDAELWSDAQLRHWLESEADFRFPRPSKATIRSFRAKLAIAAQSLPRPRESSHTGYTGGPFGPFASPRRNPTSSARKPTIRETFESFGFRITNTGGGSTAYERRIGRKGYALVTVDEDGTGFEVPRHLSEPTLLGLYKEYGDEGKLIRFPTLRALFQALSAGKIRELR